MDNKKIFISYSHKDKELKDQVVSHLNAIKLPIDIWVDKSEIDAGDEWEIKIKNAIEQSEMAILLISTDFLNSKFITEKELPWVITRKSLYNYRVIPFILKPSVWDEQEFYKTLEVKPKEKALIKYSEENGDRDEILVDFAKEVKELIGKKKEIIEVIEDNNLFYQTFAIYRVLELYDKDEEYSFKLTSNLSIYKKGQEYPIEIWKFVNEIKSVEEYAKIITKMTCNGIGYDPFNSYGVIQNSRLSSNLLELSFFLKTVKMYLPNPIPEELAINFFHKQDIKTLTNIFFQGIEQVNNFSHLTIFENFEILGYTDNELRINIFNKITEKFKIKLTDDGENIFALEPFLNVFKKALDHMEINKKNFIDFHTLISKVDILKLPYENKNNLDFMSSNSDLVEKNLSQSIDININKLYVQSKARFYYKNQDTSYENIDNLSDWLKNQIDSKDFLILLGDFGHGKTTFFKHMTAQLSNEYTDGEFIPIYLSLRQHFTKNGNLKDAVSNAVMPRRKMTDEFWNEHKWLIFCDGFDELNIYHQNEPNWITLVFSTLLCESEKANIKIVLSSRPVLFLDPSVKKETVNNFDRLILKPFDELQITEWLENWSKYNQEINIEMIRERNLLEVSQTPVMLFLIATIFHEELNDGNIKYSKSQIYKKFFDWTAKNGGLIETNECLKHKVPENYREILQEIACQIFTHPDATSGMLHYEVLLKQLGEKFGSINLKEFLNQKIFVAHAFKESIPEHIEFLHQSLREYLVAEKMFNSYYKFCTTNFKDSPTYQFEYNQIIFTKPLSQAKLDFFKDIISSVSKKEKEKIQMLQLFKIDIGSIGEYFIRNDNNLFEVFSYFENEVINTNRHGIFNVIIGNIVMLDFMFKTYCELYVDIGELKKVQNFFESNKEYNVFQKIIQRMFKNFTFKHIKLYDINFDNFEFNNTIFAEAIFSGNSFKNTKISNSKFIPNKDAETIFMDCSFDKTIFYDTIFSKVKFKNTILKNLEGYKIAEFIDVEFENCTFDSCIIYSPNYKNSRFLNCVFIDVDFISEVDCTLINSNDYKKINKIDIEFVNCISRDKYNDEHKKWNIIDNDDSIWRDSKDFR